MKNWFKVYNGTKFYRKKYTFTLKLSFDFKSKPNF